MKNQTTREDRNERILAIGEFQKAINKVIREENIPCLYDHFKNDFNIGGYHVAQRQSYAFQQLKKLLNSEKIYCHQKNWQDLVSISDEIQHITAQLYLYRDLISNAADRPLYTPEIQLYQLHYNIAERNHDMLFNQGLQACYNYWDRIGDMIEPFFPGMLEPKQVDFSKTITLIKVKNPDYMIGTYKWLKDFQENEYKELNGLRRDAVHYINPSTENIFNHYEIITNKEKVQEQYEKKYAIAEFFKKHSAFAIEGLVMAVKFIDEVIGKKSAVLLNEKRN